MRKTPYHLICGLLIVCALSTANAQPAPHFSLPGTESPVSLQALRGQMVYLDFWASWCVPCRQSFPWMNALQEKYRAQGLIVLAINLDQDEQAAHRFLDQYPVNFTVAFDPQGKVAERYKLKGMPTSYLIDRDGQVLMTHIGFRSRDIEILEARIAAQLIQSLPDDSQ